MKRLTYSGITRLAEAHFCKVIGAYLFAVLIWVHVLLSSVCLLRILQIFCYYIRKQYLTQLWSVQKWRSQLILGYFLNFLNWFYWVTVPIPSAQSGPSHRCPAAYCVLTLSVRAAVIILYCTIFPKLRPHPCSHPKQTILNRRLIDHSKTFARDNLQFNNCINQNKEARSSKSNYLLKYNSFPTAKCKKI